MEHPTRLDSIVLFILLIVAAWLFVEGFKLDVQFGSGDFGPGGLPILIFGSIAFFSAVLVIRNLVVLMQGKGRALDTEQKPHAEKDTPYQIREILPISVIIITTVYIASIQYLGFLITTPVFLLSIYLLVGAQHYRISLRKAAGGTLFAIIAASFLTFVFVSLLNVPLPIQPRFFQ